MQVQQQTDEELIAEVLNGNVAVYSELVKRHQRFVFTLGIRFAKNREDAEEIAQDCFVKAYRALGSYKQSAKFTTWLYSITYTTAMSFLRKKRMDIVSIDDYETGLRLESHVSDLQANHVEQQSAHAYLNQAINTLSAEDSAIITLFYKGELSQEEIGQMLGLTANAVKVKLHRARIKLKDKLALLLKDEVKELI